MIKGVGSDITVNVIASVIASLFFLAAGFVWGKYKERQRKFGKNLEEYDFYPFIVTRENFGEFSLKDFRLGMHYFLKNEDHTAVVATWKLLRARIIKNTNGPFNAKGTDVAMEELTLSYERLEME